MEKPAKTAALPAEKVTDYYEFLQIIPSAESETIYRIYRFHATRYHPDNPVTGDPEKFLLLQRAFEVLSDPKRRAEYDQPGNNEKNNDPAMYHNSKNGH